MVFFLIPLDRICLKRMIKPVLFWPCYCAAQTYRNVFAICVIWEAFRKFLAIWQLSIFFVSLEIGNYKYQFVKLVALLSPILIQQNYRSIHLLA